MFVERYFLKTKYVKTQAYGMQMKNNISSTGKLKILIPSRYSELNPQTCNFVK